MTRSCNPTQRSGPANVISTVRVLTPTYEASAVCQAVQALGLQDSTYPSHVSYVHECTCTVRVPTIQRPMAHTQVGGLVWVHGAVKADPRLESNLCVFSHNPVPSVEAERVAGMSWQVFLGRYRKQGTAAERSTQAEEEGLVTSKDVRPPRPASR